MRGRAKTKTFPEGAQRSRVTTRGPLRKAVVPACLPGLGDNHAHGRVEGAVLLGAGLRVHALRVAPTALISARPAAGLQQESFAESSGWAPLGREVKLLTNDPIPEGVQPEKAQHTK